MCHVVSIMTLCWLLSASWLGLNCLKKPHAEKNGLKQFLLRQQIAYEKEELQGFPSVFAENVHK